MRKALAENGIDVHLIKILCRIPYEPVIGAGEPLSSPTVADSLNPHPVGPRAAFWRS
jgi:hypothetical protein